MPVAVSNPGHGLEPSFLDRFAVLRACAKGAVLDPVQRVSHLVEQGSSGLCMRKLLIPQRAAGALVAGVVRGPVAWITDAGDGALEPRECSLLFHQQSLSVVLECHRSSLNPDGSSITAHQRRENRPLETFAHRGALHRARGEHDESYAASLHRAADLPSAYAPPGTPESPRAPAGTLAAQAGTCRGRNGGPPAEMPIEIRAQVPPRQSRTTTHTSGSTPQTGDRRADLRRTPIRWLAPAR